MGLKEIVKEPTKCYVDNNVAIHWVKTGKITEGNQYLELSYHQPRCWEKEGKIIIRGVDTKDIVSDLGSKPCGPDEYTRFLMVMCGYETWVIHNPRSTMTMV